ncbi:MAG: hypothetical protein AB7G93_04960 [Bdellovibrionales bacterium]
MMIATLWISSAFSAEGDPDLSASPPPPPPPHLREILSHLNDRLRAATPEEAQVQLQRALGEAQEIIPGLWVMERTSLRASTDEIISAYRFAEVLHRHNGLSLLLIATWYGLNSPGFDGLILDAEKNVVANFSLKTLRTSKSDKYINAIKLAAKNIRRFSTIQSWIHLVYSQATGEVPPEGFSLDASPLPVPNVELETFQWKARSYENLAILFGAGMRRPSWTLVDIRDESHLNLRELSSAKEYSRIDHPQRIIVRKGNTVLTAEGGKIYQHQVHAGRCAEFLRSIMSNMSKALSFWPWSQ